MLLELIPPTASEMKAFTYILGAIFAIGGLAVAGNAIMKFMDRFRTPLVTAVEFAEYKRRVEAVEERIRESNERIEHVQEVMTAASEARMDKMLLAIQHLKNR